MLWLLPLAKFWNDKEDDDARERAEGETCPTVSLQSAKEMHA
jgi:hypothetical protein